MVPEPGCRCEGPGSPVVSRFAFVGVPALAGAGLEGRLKPELQRRPEQTETRPGSPVAPRPGYFVADTPPLRRNHFPIRNHFPKPKCYNQFGSVKPPLRQIRPAA